MKTQLLRIGIALFFLFYFAEVAAAGKVESDFDSKADFSRYKTFMWIQKPEMDDPLMDERIVNSINAELASKGWTLVQEGGDVGVSAHVATKKKHTLETFYNGFGGGWGWHWWGGGMGIATTRVDTYTVGTIVIDLFDSSTRQLVWRGWVTDALPDKPQKEEKKLEKEIGKLFKNFPPKAKKE
jgi:Domain of unknown function (DUF4136)